MLKKVLIQTLPLITDRIEIINASHVRCKYNEASHRLCIFKILYLHKNAFQLISSAVFFNIFYTYTCENAHIGIQTWIIPHHTNTLAHAF